MSYGPKAIHELIEDAGVRYPVSVAYIERKYPLENVQIDGDGNTMMVSELLSEVEAEKFESRADLEEKLEPVVAAESEARQRDILERVKRSVFGG